MLEKFDKERLHLYTTYLLAFSIPIGWILSLKVFPLWVLTGILLINKQKLKNLNHKSFVYASVAFFVLYIIGLLYTQDLRAGIRQLSFKFYLPLSAFIIAINSESYKKNFAQILKFYVFGAIGAMILIYLIGVIRSIHIEAGKIIFNPILEKGLSLKEAILSNKFVFYYMNFSYFKHNMYLSIQLILAVIAFCYLKLFSNYKFFKSNLNATLFLLISSITIFLLASRTNYLAYYITLMLLIFKCRAKYPLLKIALVTILSILAIAYSPRYSYVIEKFQQYKTQNDIESFIEKYFSRYIFWKTAFEIVKGKEWCGVGTGDLQWLLMKYYAKKGYYRFVDPSYNTHNEFIENFARLGIFALLLLIYLIVYPFVVGLIERKWILPLFLVIVVINFMLEVHLNRVEGVLFFAFFNALLLYAEPKADY